MHSPTPLDSDGSSASGPRETLRFVACGSVDDGKSTLIGRLLYEGRHVFDDQLQSLKRDSSRYGTQGQNLDYALLLDGLKSEQEQGITIDVAYRYFATEKRRYIVADTPGHEQYTQNMATGASFADLAVILVDVKKGIQRQTVRHSRILSGMGVRSVILAVNKMDLVGFEKKAFDSVVENFFALAKSLRFSQIVPIPLCCVDGDNVVAKSRRMPWYTGLPLLSQLDAMDLSHDEKPSPLRLPIQMVLRPHEDFRGYSGRIASGTLRVGDRVQIQPSGEVTVVQSILSGFDRVDLAFKGSSITVTLQDPVDVSRGCVISCASAPAHMTSDFRATILWFDQDPLDTSRTYILKCGTRETSARITDLAIPSDLKSGDGILQNQLEKNAITQARVQTSAPVMCESYETNRTLGSFILIDKLTKATVGAGMIDSTWHATDSRLSGCSGVDKAARARQKLQRAQCLWLTGLSGAGKTTIAELLEKSLHAKGKHTYVIDGDAVRQGLCRDLGFSEMDRRTHVLRVAEVARLMVDAGLLVIVSLISPFAQERHVARSLFAKDEFTEIYVSTPLAICEMRDPKGLYAKARRGELTMFTGLDSPYEVPKSPDIVLDTEMLSADQCVDQILATMRI